MQRTTAATVGLLFVLGVVLVLVLGGGSRQKPSSKPAPSSSAAAFVAAPSASVAVPPAAAVGLADAGDGGVEALFDTLPDGRRVPELPATAPKAISFGVVLVAYAGAESAPKEARGKEEARKRAEQLLEDARRDFGSAVTKGDPGSSSDAGRIPRGILEPAVEYLLFTLDKGAVYPAPIDTPRGYWLVRRND